MFTKTNGAAVQGIDALMIKKKCRWNKDSDSALSDSPTPP